MTGLATYHSTKRVKAGEIIRVHPDTDACVVRAEDGGEIRVPLRPGLASLAKPGWIYAESAVDGQSVWEPENFGHLYASRASNL